MGRPPKQYNLEPSADLSYIIGTVLSDGWVTRHRVSMAVKEWEYAQRFMVALQNIGSGITKMTKTKNPQGVPLYLVGIGSRVLYAFMEPFKSSPWLAKPLIDAHPWAFLSGFFDGDGCVSKFNNRPAHSLFPYRALFRGSNESLMDLIKVILETLGLHPKKYSAVSTSEPTPGYTYTRRMFSIELLRRAEVWMFLVSAQPIKGRELYQAV